MTISSIEKKISLLEEQSRKSTSSSNGAMARIYGKLKQIAERGRDMGLNDNSSIAEICAANIDWDNPCDFFRVLRYVVDLRKELKTDGHAPITDEFRSRLLDWLASRGPSTYENTLFPGTKLPLNTDDRAVYNELCSHIRSSMDCDPDTWNH